MKSKAKPKTKADLERELELLKQFKPLQSVLVAGALLTVISDRVSKGETAVTLATVLREADQLAAKHQASQSIRKLLGDW